MQDLALSEGALPKHLHTAMFTASTDNRMLTIRSYKKGALPKHLHTAIFTTNTDNRMLTIK